MIITRTPFRISFAGGGSDLQAFYSREPGCVLSTAINQYMYITVKERFGNTFRVSYSKTEVVEQSTEIQHPIVRECLTECRIKKGLEIISMADLPAQSGMGSSSSFTIGLLHALYALQGKAVTAEKLAQGACNIEIERLKEPIGKQDQYIAAYGGLQFIEFRPDGEVYVDPVVCSPQTRRELNRRLIMFYTGITRQASSVLTKQRDNTARHLAHLRELCRLAQEMRSVITAGADLNQFGKLLHCAWLRKKMLESSISNDLIEQYYELAMAAGALGGKLLGAGGGGFLLFFCEPHYQDNLREALSDLTEIPFGLEPQGSKIIYVGGDRW